MRLIFSPSITAFLQPGFPAVIGLAMNILPYTTFNSKLPYAGLCIKKRISHNSCGKPVLSFCNEVSGIRTPDNLIKSQVLYRLS